jgi:hypothetical protein
MRHKLHCDARATWRLENLSDDRIPGYYYQVDYTLTEVPEECAYFYTQAE